MKNTSEQKILLLSVGFNLSAFIIFVIGEIFNIFQPVAVSFSSIIIIAMSNFVSDLFQYNNSNMPQLDKCRFLGILLSFSLFISCIAFLLLSARIGFNNKILIVINESLFALIGLSFLVNHTIRFLIVIKNEVYVKKTYKNFEFSSSDF